LSTSTVGKSTLARAGGGERGQRKANPRLCALVTARGRPLPPLDLERLLDASLGAR
jgi:hypothetical protein